LARHRVSGTVSPGRASFHPKQPGLVLLTLFPSAYVDNSLLTAVLIGVLVIWLLTEFYGWPQSGLVVPGYLAGVFVIQPRAGLVVLGEAILTYLLARLLARGLPRILPLDRTFGRNRFFLLLLVSVGVRLFVEGGSFSSLMAQLGVPIDSSFNSLGLVLVPLTANAMWRTGLFRGLPMVALPTITVYLLLLFVLLPHTNLSFAQFELTYEDLSRDFISSPRAYMLLLVGALMATHMAVRYGWDAGGIIIPGLLAITWVQPEKLLATMVEVAIIVFALRILQRLPPLRTANLTGMRPLILAFTAAYFVKLVLSYALADKYPGLRVTDLYGFGYLLSALIAVRCWRSASFPRVVFPALGISLAAFIVGTLLGVGLEQMRPLPTEKIAVAIDQRPGPAWRAATEIALAPAGSPDPTIQPELRDAWRVALTGSPFNGEHLRADLYPDGMLLHSGGQNLYGAAWLRPRSDQGLTIVVPDAASEPGLAEAAVVLTETLDAHALLLSPAPALLRQARSLGHAVLELRSGRSTLFSVARKLPEGIDLKRLSMVVPDLVPDWDLPGDYGADARLELNEDQLLAVALKRFDLPNPGLRLPLYDPHALPTPAADVRQSADPIPDLLFLRRAVLLPMLRARTGDQRWAQLAAAQAQRLDLVVAVDDEIISLGPSSDRSPPHFTLWLRRAGGDPLIFEVRAARRHYLAAEVARTWWAGTHAAALLVHDAGADLDAQALQRASTASPELSVLRALALDSPGSTVVSVDAYREDEFPGADAVISIGRPLGPGDQVPTYVDPVRLLVEGSGGKVAYYDGAYQRIRFYDPANPRDDVVRNAGGQYVTVYLSPLFRDRFATPSTSAALRTLLSGSDIELGSQVLDELLEAPALDPQIAEERFGRLLSSLARHATTGHPGELDRLSRLARQDDMQVWAFLDRDDGLPYLVVDGDDARLISAMARSRGELSPDPNHPPEVRLYGLSAALERSTQ